MFERYKCVKGEELKSLNSPCEGTQVNKKGLFSQ